ncbi:MAG: transglutaminase domain-containing protein [Planctomycetota bacterium]
MLARTLLPLLALALCLPTAFAQVPAGETAVTYRVTQTVTLTDIGAKAHSVRMWVAVPDEDRHQDLLDFEVTGAPTAWTLVEDADRRGRFVYFEAIDPGRDSLDLEVTFTLRREPSLTAVDPATTGVISPALRSLLEEYLRLDSPHMEVTPALKKRADEVCGKETNIAVQVAKLLDHVADSVDHYSKDPTKPRCGVGDARACLEQGGGCCTDLHSLFIAMARARGIPARLQMGYRLLEKNVGKTVDPGYRCWVEYFVPGHGWVGADIVEADATAGLGRDRWFRGLTARRLHLNEGRDFVFGPEFKGKPVNHMSIAYAEIDGKPARILPEGELAPQISRRVHFDEITSPRSAALTTASMR